MPLSRFRRQYEQLSQFEKGKIIGMMEAGWSARRVARQLRRSDCVVRRCWDQWIREIPFARRPGSGRLQQTSHREDHHIVRSARVQPTASSAAIQAQCRTRGNWNAAEWNQVVFSDECRLNLSTDDNCVRVWRPRGKRLNTAFALQRHIAPSAGVMVWGVIAYNTRSLLVLIRGTMAAQRYVRDIMQPHVLSLMQRLPGANKIFQQDNARPQVKSVIRLSPHCYYLFLACPIPRFVSNRAYLRPFEMKRRTSHEFERTRGKITANIERNVSRHHTELVGPNARSYSIVHSQRIQQSITTLFGEL
ncbi:transposable element Tcb1 transposase [Trichonephila clavipes]|nr:transposable element Tcb1 transposase [Trichonephila clavipes]